ncbi:MAG: 1-acyl-sn-glycerol-3-phosphate acyltransferase [Oscillospiraceae bacterium]|nr:1-acyl-sn-glycerol-3-phosphate acyltransferase [Oscillospiraceae bacterium]
MFYKICCRLVKFFLLFAFRIKVYGAENVPSGGGVIIAVNHRSNWDVPVAGASCPRRLTFMAKSELFKNPVFAGLISSLGAFPIKRGKGDIGAVKAALTILSQERAMLIFPEGTRNHTGKPLARIKEGLALFAIRAEVPVVPVFIEGEYKWLSKITVTYGAPMYFKEYYGKKTAPEQLAEVSAEIYKTMWSLKSD